MIDIYIEITLYEPYLNQQWATTLNYDFLQLPVSIAPKFFHQDLDGLFLWEQLEGEWLLAEKWSSEGDGR